MQREEQGRGQSNQSRIYLVVCVGHCWIICHNIHREGANSLTVFMDDSGVASLSLLPLPHAARWNAESFPSSRRCFLLFLGLWWWRTRRLCWLRAPATADDPSPPARTACSRLHGRSWLHDWTLKQKMLTHHHAMPECPLLMSHIALLQTPDPVLNSFIHGGCRWMIRGKRRCVSTECSTQLSFYAPTLEGRWHAVLER